MPNSSRLLFAVATLIERSIADLPPGHIIKRASEIDVQQVRTYAEMCARDEGYADAIIVKAEQP